MRNTNLAHSAITTLTLVFSFISINCFSQCNEYVDAGEDLYLCESGIEIDLDGFASGTPVRTTWSPKYKVADIYNLQTTANITGPMIISLSAIYDSTDGQELVENGEFEDGNVGFETDLNHLTATGVNLSFGDYVVTEDPQLAHDDWPSCKDVSGSGKMMVIYGNENSRATEKIWCQTIDNIIPGNTYRASVMLGSLTKEIPQELFFEINGERIETKLEFSNVNCDWLKYSIYWTADTDVVDLCIMEEYKDLSDVSYACAHYALDNISFQTSCTAQDELEIFFDDMTIDVNEPEPLTCSNLQTVLVGTGTTPFGMNYLENWSTSDGEFEGDGFTNTIVATSSGTYTYTFYSHDTHCFLKKDVEVISEMEYPEAIVELNSQLNCEISEVTLNGGLSSQGSNMIYNWSTADGNIISGSQTLFPIVDKEGTYTLTVSNENNGCESQVEIELMNMASPPSIEINSPSLLTCNQSTINIDASGSDQGVGISYQWTTIDGSILTGENSLNPSINSPGEYILNIYNEANGCQSAASIFVEENTIIPEAIMTTPDMLTCELEETNLSFQGLNLMDNFEISWLNQNGDILSNEPSLLVNEPGLYNLHILNTETGCESFQDVAVAENILEPEFDILSIPIIDCKTTSTNIDVEIEDEELYNFFWSTNEGEISNGENSVQVEVGSAGEYSLTVVNKNTGCSSEQIITIEEDLVDPVIEIGEPDALTCANEIIQLDGISDNSFEFLWSNLEGYEINNFNSALATISEAGIYFLTVRNPRNGCESTASIEIIEDRNEPYIEFEVPEVISCNTLDVQVEITNSNNFEDLSFEWSTLNGEIDFDSKSATPIISKAGTYNVVITNEINGCTKLHTIDIEENTQQPDVEVGADLQLTCEEDFLFLNANSTLMNLELQWSTANGNIISGSQTFNPQINAPGIYTLTVTDPLNGCQSVDEIEVEQDQNSPVIDIEADHVINCFQKEIELDASASDSGEGFSFEWYSPDGNFLSSTNEISPVINSAGTYLLTVANNDNRCTTVSSITIVEDIEDPDIQISDPDILNCLNKESRVDILSNTDNLIFEWVNEGTVISTSQEYQILSQSGVYSLFVFNNESGCSNSLEFEITEDVIEPLVDAGVSQLITCTESEINLLGSTDDNSNLLIEWTTNDGHIVAGANTLEPIVDKPGYYYLNVLNMQNGCEQTAEVLVEADQDIPVISILEPQILNCEIESTYLDARFSSTEASLIYTWSTTDGVINSGANTLLPEVSAPGTYNLMITNPINNCTVNSEIYLSQDVEFPEPEVINTGMLSCSEQSIELEATNVDIQNQTIEWSTADGNILEVKNITNAVVDQAGIYQLSVTSLDNACSSIIEIEVELDANAPQAVVALPDALTCLNKEVRLDGSNSSQGTNILFDWTTTSGNIVDDPQSLNPLIDQAGEYTLTIFNEENGCSSSKTVLVLEEYQVPLVQVLEPDVLDCEIHSAEIEIVYDQAMNLSFAWTNLNSQSHSISVDAPGIYECIVTNEDNGCTAIIQQQVEENISIPEFTFLPSRNLSCDNLSTFISILVETENQLIYEWHSTDGNILDFQNQKTVLVDKEGEYILTVTDTESHCSYTNSIFISSDISEPEFDISEPDILNCNVKNTVLEVQVDAISGHSISWSHDGVVIQAAENISSLNVIEPGIYSVELTAQTNGCSRLLSVEVFEDLTMPQFILEQSYLITCREPELEIIPAELDQGNEFTYTWSTLSGTIKEDNGAFGIVTNQAGVYEFQIMNALNGCMNSAIVVVESDIEPPSVLIAEPGILNCKIDMVEIKPTISNVENPNVAWLTDNGNITSYVNNGITVDKSGEYVLLVTNVANGCSENVVIEVQEDRQIPDIDAGTDEKLTCAINEVRLNGTAADENSLAYIWSTGNGHISDGGNTLNPLINEPGIYSLTVINTENGCLNSDDLLVLREENVPEIIVSDFIEPKCYLETGGIHFIGVEGGFGPYLFSIDGGNTFGENQNFDNLNPGTYDLVVRDQNGCELSERMEIEPAPYLQIDLSPTVEIVLGSSQVLSPKLSNIAQENIEQIIWTPSEGLSCSDCLSPSVLASEDMIYEIQIITKNGCDAKAQIELRVDKEQGVYIPNSFSPNSDGINDVFFINAKEGVVKMIHDFQIFDRWGNKIYLNSNFLPNDPKHGWNGTFRSGELNNGVFVYYALIEFLDGRKKLFKGDLTLMN